MLNDWGNFDFETGKVLWTVGVVIVGIIAAIFVISIAAGILEP